MKINFYKKRREDIVPLASLAFLLALFIAAYISDGGTHIFGSTVDWLNQHSVIPDSFRQLFYSTHDLFPDFDISVGAGQNIFYYAYYGLYSPVILLSYLLPFVPMHIYLSAASIAALFADLFIFYFRARKKHSPGISAILTALFIFSSSLVFHSHRHVMFVIYMPFLLLAFSTCDRLFEKGKRAPLAVLGFLLLTTSFYFAVGSFTAVIIYSVYLALSQKDGLNKAARVKIYHVLLSLFVSGISAMFLLIPTVLALLSGRSPLSSEAAETALPLLPVISSTVYYQYSMGLTATGITGIVIGFFSKKKEIIFISAVLSVFILFPVLPYLMNAGMYTDGKVLIPLLPLAMIPLGNLLDNLSARRGYPTAAFPTAAAALCAIAVYAAFTDADLNIAVCALFAAEGLLFCVLALLVLRRGRPLIPMLLPVTAVAVAVCIVATFQDKLVPLSRRTYISNDDIEALYSVAAENDSGFYRTGCLVDPFASVNRVYGKGYNQTTVYSSSSNRNYKRFYLEEFCSNLPYRNPALITQTSNSAFNRYMGIKYIIAYADSELEDYEKTAERNGLALFTCDNALSVGYRASQIMSLDEFSKLDYPYNVEALMNYLIVEDEPDASGYTSSLQKLDVPSLSLTMLSSDKITKSESGYLINSDTDFELTLTPEADTAGGLLFVRMTACNSYDMSDGDISVSINGIGNKLTSDGWKYHNGNYSFEYSLYGENDTFRLSFSAGYYTLSDIEVYSLQYDNGRALTEKARDSLIIDSELTKGDEIYGSIDCSDDGIIMLTVPYDNGFSVYVDGSEVEYFMADTAFIGFRADAGHHDVKIVFNAPGACAGRIISCVGIAAFALLLTSDLLLPIKRKKYKTATAVSEIKN